MGIVRPIMEAYPLAWVFFVPFIIVSTFIIVNLIIAIVVDAMNEMNESEEESIAKVSDKNDDIKTELVHLRNEMKELKEQLKMKEQELEDLQEVLDELNLSVPNPPLPDVPERAWVSVPDNIYQPSGQEYLQTPLQMRPVASLRRGKTGCPDLFRDLCFGQ